MLAGAANEQTATNFAKDQKQIAKRLISDLKEAMVIAAGAFGLGNAEVPFLNPASFLYVVRADGVYIVTDFLPATNMPTQTYWAEPGVANGMESLKNLSRRKHGYTNPVGIVIPLYALDKDKAAATLAPIARQVCEEMKSKMFITDLRIPLGFEEFESLLRAFVTDHPNVDSNVFVMMRFDDGKEHEKIYSAIKSRMKEYGLNAIRADERAYAEDLWQNVVLYMLGSRYGVAVFEEINEQSFNPSVSIELGFMLAHKKRCLILKDSRMHRMPTDIIGRLYKEFDRFDITNSVKSCVDNWAKDIGIPQLSE